MRLQQQLGIAGALGHGQDLAGQVVGRAHVAAEQVVRPQPEQRAHQPRAGSDALAQLQRVVEARLGVGRDVTLRGQQQAAQAELERELGRRGLVRPRDLADQLEPALEVLGGLAVRALGDGLLAGRERVLELLAALAGVLEVVGEDRGRNAAGALQAQAELAVPGGAGGERDALVDGLPGRDVLEEVGQLGLELVLGDQVAAGDRLEARGDLVQPAELGIERAHPRGAEAAPDHRRGLERELLLGRQAVEPAQDQAVQRRRQLLVRAEADVVQVAEQLLDEERVALRALRDDVHELVRGLGGEARELAQLELDQLRRLVLAERLEPQLAPAATEPPGGRPRRAGPGARAPRS